MVEIDLIIQQEPMVVLEVQVVVDILLVEQELHLKVIMVVILLAHLVMKVLVVEVLAVLDKMQHHHFRVMVV